MNELFMACLQAMNVGTTIIRYGNIGMVADRITEKPMADMQAVYTYARMLGREALNGMGFDTSSERWFLFLATATGVFAGPSLSSSRTMLARIAPPAMMAEFYGLYALCGKATSFLAPLTVAIVTQATASQRVGLGSVIIFLIVGLLLMFFVKEEQSTAHEH